MTTDSDWDALRARIAQLREAVAAEIRDYPAPIPACDAQYNYLLERRTALAAALVLTVVFALQEAWSTLGKRALISATH